MTAQIDSESFPDPTKLTKGEFAKSQETRTKILEAAITCLADRGYHATSTTAVYKQAGLSRTAMLYHFPSRTALINATTQYVFRRRVELVQQLIGELVKDQSFHGQSVGVTWRQTHFKEFAAFCELATAARTDKELAKIYSPLFAEYDKARRDISRELARSNQAASPGFNLRCDITRFLIEGIAQQDGLTYNAKERLDQVTAFLVKLWDDKDQTFSEMIDLIATKDG